MFFGKNIRCFAQRFQFPYPKFWGRVTKIWVGELKRIGEKVPMEFPLSFARSLVFAIRSRSHLAPDIFGDGGAQHGKYLAARWGFCKPARPSASITLPAFHLVGRMTIVNIPWFRAVVFLDKEFRDGRCKKNTNVFFFPPDTFQFPYPFFGPAYSK